MERLRGSGCRCTHFRYAEPYAGRRRMPYGPGLDISGSAHERRSHVGKRILKFDQARGSHELGDSAIEVDGRFEALLADLFVRNLVIALIGIAADFGEVQII